MEPVDEAEVEFTHENIPAPKNPVIVSGTPSSMESSFDLSWAPGRRRRPESTNETFNCLIHGWERLSSRALWEAKQANSSLGFQHQGSRSLGGRRGQSSPHLRTPTPDEELVSPATNMSVLELVQSYESWTQHRNTPKPF